VGATPCSSSGLSTAMSTPGSGADGGAHARSRHVASTPAQMSAPLQRARAAIAESIDDQMVGELTRSMVEAVSVPGITFQQQEHAILLNVHAALHKVLAAARQAPQALAEAEEAAAAAAAATSTAAGTSGADADTAPDAAVDAAVDAAGPAFPAPKAAAGASAAGSRAAGARAAGPRAPPKRGASARLSVSSGKQPMPAIPEEMVQGALGAVLALTHGAAAPYPRSTGSREVLRTTESIEAAQARAASQVGGAPMGAPSLQAAPSQPLGLEVRWQGMVVPVPGPGDPAGEATGTATGGERPSTS
jgi:hypothetical protein